MRQLVSLEEGLEMVLNQVRAVGTELMDMPEAQGRILAENVTSSMNIPPFNRSPLDGYAVRSADIVPAKPECPVELAIVDEIPAGSYSDIVVAQNQTVKILTGAPIPEGADVILRFEDIEQLAESIQVFHPVKSHTNYCFAGEDINQGDTVLTAGTLLGPAEIGVLASLGIQRVRVFKMPKIGILSTGNELVDLHESLNPGKIYNSNLYTLTAHTREMGCQPVCAGIAPDNSSAISKKLDKALSEVDLLITTGGVSVGDYDVVKDSLLQVGAEILFWRLNMRPGTPVVCSVKEGKLIISLSGNPSAAMVVFFLLVVPALKMLRGMKCCSNTITTMQLQDEFTKPSSQRRFLLCHSYVDQGIMKVKLTGKQNPGRVKSMLGCNALIDVAANSGPLRAGDNVEVVLVSN